MTVTEIQNSCSTKPRRISCPNKFLPSLSAIIELNRSVLTFIRKSPQSAFGSVVFGVVTLALCVESYYSFWDVVKEIQEVYFS